MSIGNLQKILIHDIHNLLCDLILKHESTSPEFIWGFQCSLLGSKIHYLGQEKSNSLHGSTQVVNIHYLGQIHNLGQNRFTTPVTMPLSKMVAKLIPRPLTPKRGRESAGSLSEAKKGVAWAYGA